MRPILPEDDAGSPHDTEEAEPEGRRMQPVTSKSATAVAAVDSVDRDNNNHMIHLLYTRQDYDECLELIGETLAASGGACAYALHVRALIQRQRGDIHGSLQLFQGAAQLQPHSTATLKQVARSLFLLGKHKAALDVYDEAAKLGGDGDWELWHNRGLCYLALKRPEKAVDCFRRAGAVQAHDATLLQMGRAHALLEDYKQAIEVYSAALELCPDNADILTTVGLLHLRRGENMQAFEFLGSALTHDPRNAKTILAAGSILQDHSDADVALVKYRVAALATPNSAQLWNNIGMCFFGKRRYVAAVACLKRALYLDPFEWIISYNLGLVHLNTGQYASAFHYLSASINLKPSFASSYMYLGIALSRLDDSENTCSAYERALELESDHLVELNYTITLTRLGESARAREHHRRFQELFRGLDADARNADNEVQEQAHRLEKLLL